VSRKQVMKGCSHAYVKNLLRFVRSHPVAARLHGLGPRPFGSVVTFNEQASDTPPPYLLSAGRQNR
jgi:hypothetical protein